MSYPHKNNLLAGLPALPLPDELFQTLAEGKTTRIERIISHGQASPEDFWYYQDQHEWVMVMQGEAILCVESVDTDSLAGTATDTARDTSIDKKIQQQIRLGPGDYLTIPAHTRHRVVWTTPDQPTIWLAVFYS